MSKISNDIRKKISCPQFGQKDYGSWGALPLSQRTKIRMLCDTCDGFERDLDYLYSRHVSKEAMQNLKDLVNTGLDVRLKEDVRLKPKYYCSILNEVGAEIRGYGNTIDKAICDCALEYFRRFINGK